MRRTEKSEMNEGDESAGDQDDDADVVESVPADGDLRENVSESRRWSRGLVRTFSEWARRVWKEAEKPIREFVSSGGRRGEGDAPRQIAAPSRNDAKPAVSLHPTLG
jgi:hypothetical protein